MAGEDAADSKCDECQVAEHAEGEEPWVRRVAAAVVCTAGPNDRVKPLEHVPDKKVDGQHTSQKRQDAAAGASQ